MEKRDFELSFDDIVLLQVGLINLKRSYSSLAGELAADGLSDDAVEFEDRVSKIDKLYDILHF